MALCVESSVICQVQPKTIVYKFNQLLAEWAGHCFGATLNLTWTRFGYVGLLAWCSRIKQGILKEGTRINHEDMKSLTAPPKKKEKKKGLICGFENSTQDQ